MARVPHVARGRILSGTLHYSTNESIFEWMEVDIFVMPAGWRGWFVAKLLYPRLRVRPRPKSVDFQDAENQQWPCRMIIRHLKDLKSVCFGLDALGKIKS
ncbi:hypothetical protein TNCV_4829971 [Trichonephila clavipes]|nr:hypothetical protein TNCV_4829971 [Trichonephila clavipes]